MLNASQLDGGWKELSRRIGSTEDLEATAKDSGALVRRREIKNAADLLRLALAYGPCGMSLRTVAAWAETIGLGELSDVAALKRLRASAGWLQEVAGSLLARRLRCPAAASTGRVIPRVDSTTISQPRSDRADWRLHYSYDPKSGRAVDCQLTTAREGEHLRRGAVTAGETPPGAPRPPHGGGVPHCVRAGAHLARRAGLNPLAPPGAPGA